MIGFAFELLPWALLGGFVADALDLDGMLQPIVAILLAATLVAALGGRRSAVA